MLEDTIHTFKEVKKELNEWLDDEFLDEDEFPLNFFVDIAEEMMGRFLTKEELVELILIYG